MSALSDSHFLSWVRFASGPQTTLSPSLGWCRTLIGKWLLKKSIFTEFGFMSQENSLGLLSDSLDWYLQAVQWWYLSSLGLIDFHPDAAKDQLLRLQQRQLHNMRIWLGIIGKAHWRRLKTTTPKEKLLGTDTKKPISVPQSYINWYNAKQLPHGNKISGVQVRGNKKGGRLQKGQVAWSWWHGFGIGRRKSCICRTCRLSSLSVS